VQTALADRMKVRERCLGVVSSAADDRTTLDMAR
jgi:hypothetical protein